MPARARASRASRVREIARCLAATRVTPPARAGLRLSPMLASKGEPGGYVDVSRRPTWVRGPLRWQGAGRRTAPRFAGTQPRPRQDSYAPSGTASTASSATGAECGSWCNNDVTSGGRLGPAAWRVWRPNRRAISRARDALLARAGWSPAPVTGFFLVLVSDHQAWSRVLSDTGEDIVSAPRAVVRRGMCRHRRGSAPPRRLHSPRPSRTAASRAPA
jgi:hypothetical protein